MVTQFFIVPLLLTIYNRIAMLTGIAFYNGEMVMAIMEILMLIWFLHKALRRFVQVKRAKLLLVNVTILGWHTLSVYFIYKFLLFTAVFAQLH